MKGKNKSEPRNELKKPEIEATVENARGFCHIDFQKEEKWFAKMTFLSLATLTGLDGGMITQQDQRAENVKHTYAQGGTLSPTENTEHNGSHIKMSS